MHSFWMVFELSAVIWPDYDLHAPRLLRAHADDNVRQDSGSCAENELTVSRNGRGYPSRYTRYTRQLTSNTVILVHFSPKDAPGAYWSMTSTSIALIISSFVTSATGAISLLDAIVVVYGASSFLLFFGDSGFTLIPRTVLLLPILVSASGLSENAQCTHLFLSLPTGYAQHWRIPSPCTSGFLHLHLVRVQTNAMQPRDSFPSERASRIRIWKIS